MKRLFFIILFACPILNTTAVYPQYDTSFSGKYLIVLDIQDHFTRNHLPDSTAQNLIENINSIIKRTDPEKVIYVKSILSTLEISLKGFHVDTLPDLELDERLLIVNKCFFNKNKANSFTSDALNVYLKNNNARQIIVVGLMAEHCVTKTALGGIEKGYEVFIIPNAIAASQEKNKSKIFHKLEGKGVKFL